MIVVSHTTAITNLIQIGRLDLLREVFGQVAIPFAVHDELCEMPGQKELLQNAGWVQRVEVEDRALVSQLVCRLDAGESEAIALAIQTKADFLVIDEWKGRRVAQEFGLQIIGIVGILATAKRKGYISAIQPILDELKNKVGFRLHPSIYRQVLEDAGEI